MPVRGRRLAPSSWRGRSCARRGRSRWRSAPTRAANLEVIVSGVLVNPSQPEASSIFGFPRLPAAVRLAPRRAHRSRRCSPSRHRLSWLDDVRRSSFSTACSLGGGEGARSSPAPRAPRRDAARLRGGAFRGARRPPRVRRDRPSADGPLGRGRLTSGRSRAARRRSFAADDEVVVDSDCRRARPASTILLRHGDVRPRRASGRRRGGCRTRTSALAPSSMARAQHLARVDRGCGPPCLPAPSRRRGSRSFLVEVEDVELLPPPRPRSLVAESRRRRASVEPRDWRVSRSAPREALGAATHEPEVRCDARSRLRPPPSAGSPGPRARPASEPKRFTRRLREWVFVSFRRSVTVRRSSRSS